MSNGATFSSNNLEFHEVFRQDGTHYRQHEVDLIRALTDRSMPVK